MRRIKLDCKHKRGCGYCLEYIPSRKVGNTVTKSKCPHDVCPYHEMDNVKTYDEYAESVTDVPIAALIAKLCRAGKCL